MSGKLGYIKKRPITIGYVEAPPVMMVVTVQGPMGNINLGFERDAARALIADQLANFKLLWPDAPQPVAATVLARKS